MAPGDDADAVLVFVDLFDRSLDLVAALAGGEIFHGDGDVRVDVIRHLLRMLRDVRENVVAVQRLGTGDPINDLSFHFFYLEKFFIVNPAGAESAAFNGKG